MWKALTLPVARLLQSNESEMRSSYAIEFFFLLVVVALVAFILCMVSIANDIHAMRRTLTDETATIRVGAFLRADSLLLRADQALVIFQSLSSRLDSQLTQVRAQVHDANETTEKQTKALTQTTAAVRTTLQQTSDAIQQVADKPTPFLKVQAETPAVVTAPNVPPTPITPIPPLKENLPAVAAPKTRSGFKWHWKSWPFSKKKKPAR